MIMIMSEVVSTKPSQSVSYSMEYNGISVSDFVIVVRWGEGETGIDFVM